MRSSRKKRSRRKLTVERARAINRKRDLVEGDQKSYEVRQVRVLPGRAGLVEDWEPRFPNNEE